MKKQTALLALIAGMLSSCACDPENLIKGAMWGMEKMAGVGYFPSPEILALGNFERVEVSMSKQHLDGETQAEIELRLINGKGPDMHYSEENLARKCAELYAKEYSKIYEYQTIRIVFIQTDPFQPDNMAMSEYSFQVEDLLQ